MFEVPSTSLSHLKTKVLEEFNTAETNANLQVTFQKYDEDWGEYLDVSKTYRVKDKERLKVVVRTSLTDSADALGGQAEV